jgi:tetratricopeptide (TPR) repeat protein
MYCNVSLISRRGVAGVLIAVIQLSTLFALALTAHAEPSAPVKPKIHKGDGWAIAVPGDWNSFPGIKPPVVLYLIGDGRAGVPKFDGTLSVLKAGLQVEMFPKGALSLQEHLTRDLKELRDSGAFKPLADSEPTDITLADGTNALLYDAEFVRVQNGRISIQSKLYCEDAQGRHIVATSFITCSRPGRQSVKATALADLMRAHVKSLVLNPEKVDLTLVQPAYEKHNWNIADALELIDEGNALLAKDKFVEAAEVFRQSIKLTDKLSAAHNGLAWALLHADPNQKDDLKKGLLEAQIAVDQTEQLDYSALDTLALAYYRNGDKENAIKTINLALKLEPGHKELQARLNSFK